MRPFEEIDAEIRAAAGLKDVEALRVLAAEMQAIGTPEAQVTTLNALGIEASVTGDYASALKYYRQALALHEERGNRAGVASVTGNMGIVFRETGDYAAALEHYRRALAVHEELGGRANVARAISNLGLVYCDTGDYPSALEYYRRALALYEELGDRVSVADITGNMGILYEDTGDHPSALEHYQRALAMHEALGNRVGVANVTGNIGVWHAHMGDFSAAVEQYRRAREVYEELGNRSGVVHITGTMIRALIDLDRYDEAATLLEHQASMSMENSVVRAAHEENYATLAEIQGDLDVAHDRLMNALAITTEAGLRSQAASYHKRLRDLAQKRNDFAGFIEHNAEHQRITEEIRGKEATQRMAMMEAERRMEGERRERDKERALLFGALPRSVADRMIRGEDVSGDHFDHAAVMFLDVVGFTSHTSSMSPSDVVKMLENIFRTVDGICDAYDVIKVKTIGDSYMCFRGDEDASSNALSIAHVALDVMQHAFTWPDGTPLQFRVGIHIGPATAGVIGTQRLQYDVWGDTVNVASRMESSGEAGRVQVSEAFASELKRNTEYTIQNSMTESGNPESHEVSLVTRNSSLVTPLVPRHLSLVTIERGSIDIKGKGPMRTYWLERAS